VRTGRYGPYIKHGKINASLPRDVEPEALTMDRAVELLAAKAEKSGTKTKSAAKAKPKAKAKTKTKAKPKAKAKPKSKSKTPASTDAAE